MKKFPVQKVFKVTRFEVDKRVDSALLLLLKKSGGNSLVPSRARLTEALKKGLITINGAPAKTHYAVHLGDRIGVDPEALSSRLVDFPQETDLALAPLFECAEFVVINKPAGLLVHPTGLSREESVAHWFAARYPEASEVGEDPNRPGIVHRLDRETSGILVLARTPGAYTVLKGLFQQRQAEKTYLALVYGHLDALQGKIDTPLTRASGDLKRSLYAQDASQKTWSALTKYAVVRRYREYDLVRAFPKTGRTHQIRVHLSGLGHPIVGDKLYAYRAQRQHAPLFPERHLLHALTLTFDFSGKRYTFDAPLPDDFRGILRDIDETLEEGYDDEALKSLL